MALRSPPPPLLRTLVHALRGAALLSAACLPVFAQGAPTYRAGSLTVEAPWSRATPGGAKVGSGYMRIVNRGSEPDRLIGGTAAVAARIEVHESSTVDGVARMRPVEGGLLIRPGETVELKPGGLHAMLVDLARPLKEGEVIKGTLVFERAGTIAIEYRVGGIGAQSAGSHHHHH
jgi:periplasmic copper chaperone A